jgi:nitroreductase
MPAFDDLLRARRSIRKYLPEEPDDRILREMIAAALWAPSPSHSQPVRFIRVHSTLLKDKLGIALSEGYQHLLDLAASREKPQKLVNRINAYWRYTSFMLRAPVLVAVTTEEGSGSFSGILYEESLLDVDPYTIKGRQIAAGCTLQNVLLKGSELGVSSCILTAPLVFLHHAAVVEEIGGGELQCFLTIGYAAENPKPITRHALEDIYRVI